MDRYCLGRCYSVDRVILVRPNSGVQLVQLPLTHAAALQYLPVRASSCAPDVSSQFPPLVAASALADYDIVPRRGLDLVRP